MRMSLASCCQRVAICLSSSSAIFEYKEKRGPEGSPKFDLSLAKGGAGADADAGAGASDGARDSRGRGAGD